MIRVLGAAFTIIGCGAVGFLLASNLTYEINCLQGLITVLEGWKNDISYHQSPLPELCRFVRCEESSVIYKFFSELNKELLSNSQPDAKCGISKVLSKFSDLPASCVNLLLKLGNSLKEQEQLLFYVAWLFGSYLRLLGHLNLLITKKFLSIIQC